MSRHGQCSVCGVFFGGSSAVRLLGFSWTALRYGAIPIRSNRASLLCSYPS
jgi:hypothetical protein